MVSDCLIAIEELASHTHNASASSVASHSHLLFKNEFVNFNNANTNISVNTSVAAGTHSSRGEAYVMLAGTSVADAGVSSGAGGYTQSISISGTGGNSKHENRQPFIVVACWHRTA